MSGTLRRPFCGESRGRTALNDAIIVALDQLRSAHRERHALIIVSDGGDNASKHKFDQVMSKGAKFQGNNIFHRHFWRERSGTKSPDAGEAGQSDGWQAYFPRSRIEGCVDLHPNSRDIREQYMLGYNRPARPRKARITKIEVKSMLRTVKDCTCARAVTRRRSLLLQ